jgi:Sec-independent protein translocase protein TatA
MTTHQTPLAKEIVKEILNLTAGEKDCLIPSERGETNVHDTMELLKNLTREFKAEVNALRRQVIDLQSYVIQNEDEIKDLRECVSEMKETIEELKRKMPEDSSQYCSESSNTNIQDSVNRTTYINNEESKDNSTNRKEVNKEFKTVPLVSNSAITCYVNNTEFPLPLFDENTVNPVFHLKQLDNYLKVRNVPDEVKLTIAYKSLTGEMSKT